MMKSIVLEIKQYSRKNISTMSYSCRGSLAYKHQVPFG